MQSIFFRHWILTFALTQVVRRLKPARYGTKLIRRASHGSR